MKCEVCGHQKGQCDCLCCCPVAKIGCPYCIGPVLAYRQVAKLIQKIKDKTGHELKTQNR